MEIRIGAGSRGVSGGVDLLQGAHSFIGHHGSFPKTGRYTAGFSLAAVRLA